MVVSSDDGNLSGIIRDLKSFTSKSFIEAIKTENESRRDWFLKQFAFEASKHKRNKKFQIWTHQNHPIELVSSKFFEQKINYIHENPVKAGIVDKAEDYIYSSARDYAGEKGLIEVVFP